MTPWIYRWVYHILFGGQCGPSHTPMRPQWDPNETSMRPQWDLNETSMGQLVPNRNRCMQKPEFYNVVYIDWIGRVLHTPIPIGHKTQKYLMHSISYGSCLEWIMLSVFFTTRVPLVSVLYSISKAPFKICLTNFKKLVYILESRSKISLMLSHLTADSPSTWSLNLVWILRSKNTCVPDAPASGTPGRSHISMCWGS